MRGHRPAGNDGKGDFMNSVRFHAGPSDLQATGAGLVKRLGGIWRDDHGMCRCPAHDDRTPSLSVRVGQRVLLFKCFAGCDTSAVIQAIRRFDARALQFHPVSSSPATAPKSRFGLSPAQRLWLGAQPLAGTPAAAYLRCRGLQVLPGALRFHRHTPLGQGAGVVFRPAMITAVHEAGVLVAVQRTFLDARLPRRARDLVHPRRLLGRPLRGAVVLVPAGPVLLGLAEGTETAMSAMVLLGIPVWASLGSERLAHIAIPDHVTRLILLADNDRAGRIGAAKALAAHAREGRIVEALWPPYPHKDWNDVLRGGGKGVGNARRQMA
jgi:hypothetical protein